MRDEANQSLELCSTIDYNDESKEGEVRCLIYEEVLRNIPGIHLGILFTLVGTLACTVDNKITGSYGSQHPGEEINKTISAADSSIVLVEGDQYGALLTLSQVMNQDETIQWSIVGGESDFLSSSGEVILTRGLPSVFVQIQALNDLLVEGNENFTLTIKAVNLNITLPIPITLQDQTTEAQLAILGLSSFDYGVKINGSTTSHTFTLINSGQSLADSLSAMSLPSPFVWKGGAYPGTGGDCANELVGGTTCSLVIDFSPLSSNTYSENLTIGYGDGNSTESLIFNISGTAQASSPSLDLTPSSVLAMDLSGGISPGSAVTLTLENTGNLITGVIQSPALAGTDPGNFEVLNDNCVGNTLTPLATCTLQIRPKAVTDGSYAASISVSDGGVTSGSTVLSGTASGFVESISVVPLYPANGSLWTYYILNGNSGQDIFHQTDTDCSGTPDKLDYCVHAGEMRKVSVTSYVSCTNLSATDSLGAFDWTCDDSGVNVQFYSQLKWNKGLVDLVNAASWKSNQVTVKYSGYTVAQSSSSSWWTNPVVLAPLHTTSGAKILDGNDDDGTGPDIPYAQGSIVTINQDITNGGYSLSQDHMALVVLPGFTLTRSPSGGAGHSTIDLNYSDYCWLEGHINSSHRNDDVISGYYADYFQLRNINVENSTGNGIYIDHSEVGTANNIASFNHSSSGFFDYANLYNRYRGLTLYDNSVGFRTECSVCTFDDIVAHDNSGAGISIAWNSGVQGRNFLSYSNGDEGIAVGPTTDSVFSHLISLNNASGVLSYTGSSNLTFGDVLIANSSANGVDLYGDEVRFMNLTVSNSGGTGIINRSTNSTFWNVTTIGNGSDGFTEDYSSRTALGNFLSANNTSYGLWITSDNGKYKNIFTQGNGDYSVVLEYSSCHHNTFTGYLALTESVLCSVWSAGAQPGLIDATCTDSGVNLSNSYTGNTSDATFLLSKDMTNSYVGRIAVDDSQNASDSSGSASYVSITDWTHFENEFRFFGKNGTSVLDSGFQGRCGSASTCRIFDLRPWSVDTQIFNRNFDGINANPSFVANTTCPSVIHGNQVSTDAKSSPSTFLTHAVEILFDGVGDDDGFCESGEACLYTPHIGGYQGEGDYLTGGTCTFQDGTITGVTMYYRPIQGAP